MVVTDCGRKMPINSRDIYTTTTWGIDRCISWFRYTHFQRLNLCYRDCRTTWSHPNVDLIITDSVLDRPKAIQGFAVLNKFFCLFAEDLRRILTEINCSTNVCRDFVTYRCFVCQNDRKSNETSKDRFVPTKRTATGTFRPPFKTQNTKYLPTSTYFILLVKQQKTDLVPKCSEWAQSIGSSFLTFKSRFVTVYSILFSPVIMEAGLFHTITITVRSYLYHISIPNPST